MTRPCEKEGAPRVRVLTAQEWPLYRDLRLRALEDAPEAFGGTLAEARTRLDTDWAWIVNLGVGSGRDRPLLAEVAGNAAGMAWAKVDANDPLLVNLYQMWVAPEARGQGVAGALLAAGARWALARGARTMGLGVVCGNDAARRLYRRAGFRDAGQPAPQRPGSARMEQRMLLDLAAPLPALSSPALA